MKKLVIFLHSSSFSHDEPLTVDSLVSVLLSNPDDQESFSYLGIRTFSWILEEFTNDFSEKSIKSYLVIPSEQTLNCVLHVPTKATRQIQKALPYLVEDYIATDPDLCFIAAGELHGTTLPCSVIERQLLNGYNDFCKKYQLNCERIISFCNLHFEPTAALHVFPERIIMISSTGEHFSFSPDLLTIYLPKLINNPSEIKATEKELDNDTNETVTSDELDSNEYLNTKLPIYVYHPDSDDLSTNKEEVIHCIENFSKNHDFPYQTEVKSQSLNNFYISQAHEITKRGQDKKLINFLQGEFKVKQSREAKFKIDANWRPAAYLLLLLTFISLFSLYIDKHRYEKGAELANEQSKQLFKKIFPETKNFTSMRKRVSALLGGSSTDSSNQFIALMVGFSDGLADVNKKNLDSLEATRFQYEQNTGQLKIDINASSFDTLNELKTFLDGKGFLLEIASTSSESDGVKGRLNLSQTN